MKLQGFLAVALVVGGCEHKSKRDDQGMTAIPAAGSAIAKPNGELPAEPVARDPGPKQPSPDPAPAADTVRKPVAADLAEYTKDLKGTGKLQATIETSLGTFHCELFPERAPITVANFVGLATGKKPWLNPKTNNVQNNTPYFDGLTFHRVIPGFMIQGGDPLGQGNGGPGYMFENEFVKDLEMGPGTLAMANADDPRAGRMNTNGSQFFIMEGSRPDLVGHHTIFGKCKEVDLVKKITSVPAQDDRPTTPVTITKITFAKA